MMLPSSYARRCQRYPVDIACELVSHRWEVPVRHRITDLSAVGLWVPTTFPLVRGEHVVVTFRPPVGDELSRRWLRNELTLFARVARMVRPRARANAEGEGRLRGGMGLEFTDPRCVDRWTLRRCLRTLPPPPRGNPGRGWPPRTIH